MSIVILGIQRACVIPVIDGLLQAPMVSTGEVEPATIVAQLRQALTAVDGLSNERAGLEEALKVEKNRDNILPRIMSVSGGYDSLFREEIKKYDQLKVCLPKPGYCRSMYFLNFSVEMHLTQRLCCTNDCQKRSECGRYKEGQYIEREKNVMCGSWRTHSIARSALSNGS